MEVRALRRPYLILIGDVDNQINAKTGLGLVHWTPEACLAQLRFGSRAVNLGLPDMTPAQAATAGAQTLVVGIAPPGGRLPERWIPVLLEALDANLDLAAGLHRRLAEIPELSRRARNRGREIHDVRHSDRIFAVGTGRKGTGLRLLTVGTDCALGKKYTALAIANSLKRRGCQAHFRATGQTGILIAGSGVALDAVAADFVAGAAESLSPENAPNHWDVIEGQGSLFHPAYAGVTLGLIHGSQPDALVLCHDPTRTTLSSFPHVPIVSLEEAVPGYLAAARLTNPQAQFVGVALNTSSVSADEAGHLILETAERMGLPCVDPIRTGVEPVVDRLESWNAS
jgi:uncharacterized NAD-dependent epimerase/dehydratase family protein